MTPAASLSIVDVVERKFTAEIMTPGCAMTYAAGDRRFFALCGDGSLMMVTLTDAGEQAAIEKSAPFFDPQKDPILETGARLGDAWLFVSVLGKIHIVDLAGEQPVFPEPLVLFDRGGAKSQLARRRLATHCLARGQPALVFADAPRGFFQL